MLAVSSHGLMITHLSGDETRLTLSLLRLSAKKRSGLVIATSKPRASENEQQVVFLYHRFASCHVEFLCLKRINWQLEIAHTVGLCRRHLTSADIDLHRRAH